MDEHVSHILKLLEDGKITAQEAERLISALSGTSSPGSYAQAPPEGSSSSAQPKSVPPEGNIPPEGDIPPEGSPKSFSFKWGSKTVLPDLKAIQREVQDAVSKIDPERMAKDIRENIERSISRSMNWAEEFGSRFRFYGEGGGDMPPEPPPGHPVRTETEHKEAAISPNGRLNIANPFGEVTVEGGGDRIELDIEKKVWAPSDEEFKLAFIALLCTVQSNPGSDEADEVTIKVEAPEGFRRGRAHLNLRVPASVLVQVETTFGIVQISNLSGVAEVISTTGDITVSNLSGGGKLETHSGNIKADALSGGIWSVNSVSGQLSATKWSSGGTVSTVSGNILMEDVESGDYNLNSVSGCVRLERAGSGQPVHLNADTVSGDIRASGLIGDLDLETVSGDIAVKSNQLHSGTVSSTSGMVEIGVQEPFNGNLKIDTTSGDIRLEIPADSDSKIHIESGSGKAQCSLPSISNLQSDRRYDGVVGKGTGAINLHSNSGNLLILENR